MTAYIQPGDTVILPVRPGVLADVEKTATTLQKLVPGARIALVAGLACTEPIVYRPAADNLTAPLTGVEVRGEPIHERLGYPPDPMDAWCTACPAEVRLVNGRLAAHDIEPGLTCPNSHTRKWVPSRNDAT